jgi:ankyrin repeat protein
MKRLLHINIGLSLVACLYGMEKEKEPEIAISQSIAPHDANHHNLKKLHLGLIEAICSKNEHYVWTALQNITQDNNILLNNALTQYCPLDQLPSAGVNTKNFFNKSELQPDYPDLKTMTSLGFAIYAAQNQTKEHDDVIIDLLIKNGASINAVRGTSGCTPFHVAIKYNPDYILFLHSKTQTSEKDENQLSRSKIQIPQKDENQQLPMFTACIEPSPLKSLENLIGLGFSLNIKDRSLNTTPLHLCCKNGSKNKVELIIKHDKSLIEEIDSVGATPVFYATQGQHVEVIKLLLSNGAKTDIKTNYDHTVIDYIAIPKDNEIPNQEKTALAIANILIRSGAPLPSLPSHQEFLAKAVKENLQNKSNFYQRYMKTLVLNKTEQAMKEVKSIKKETLNETDSFGMTPLHMATILNNQAVVKEILDQHADNRITFAGKEIPNIPLVTDWLSKFPNPIDINIPDNNRRTPLAWAKKLGHANIVQLLKGAGAQDPLEDAGAV